MKLSDKWIKAGKEEDKIRHEKFNTRYCLRSWILASMKTSNNELHSAVYTYSSSAVVHLSIDRATCARVCVTIFNLATICKHDATRRSANNSQGEFTRRRNPRSTSLLVIAYDSHRALCSSTYVRFSLLSFPPSIVLSYAPFRSSLGFPPIYRPLDPCPILFHDGNIKHFSFSFPPIREQ